MIAMTKKPLQAVIRTIRQYGMLRRGDTVLVAVSGGPDSVYLARVLRAVRTTFCLSRLVLCHLDHRLRGSASREDARFVGRLARELGLACIRRSVDVTAARKKGMSLEETARDVRYRFYRDAARRVRATVLATGHTLDDQAETVLMRIIKGSSLKGILGVPPVREERGLRIIRPLIALDKGTILEALREEGAAYRIDRSNDDSVFFRNVVRNEIIPFLQQYNPRLKRALSSLAEHLREDYRFIEQARQRSRTLATRKKAAIEVPLKDMILQPKAIQKEIVRDTLERAGGSVKKLTFRHWKDVELLITHKTKGAAVDLPGGVRITRTDRALSFARRRH